MKLVHAHLALLLLFFSACTATHNKQKTHRTHTLKLQKNISVAFRGLDYVEFKVKPEFKNISIDVVAVNEKKEKKSILQKNIQFSGSLKIPLPDDIDDYKYLVAIIRAADQNGNEISAVETYKIGEQDQINAAKNKLKNR